MNVTTPVSPPSTGGRAAPTDGARAPCPVCASRGGALVERRGDFELLHCAGCDVVHSSPMQAASAEWYEAMYVVRDLAVDTRMRDYYRWALRHLRAPARVLDVGCGQGTFVAAAARAGLDAHGVDHSHAAIEAGRRHFGLATLELGGPADLLADGAEASFDGLTLFEVVEHLDDPLAALRSTLRLLRPGGLVVVSVPNRGRWPVAEFNDYPPHHLTRWSPRALSALLERAGCDVVEVAKGSRLGSIHIFYCNAARDLLYRVLRLRGAFNAGTRAEDAGAPAVSGATRTLLRVFGATARRARDAVMWLPTLLSAPFLLPFFEGYNLMAVARKQKA